VSSRAAALTRGMRLEYLTIGWNLLEGLVGIIAGVLAGSIALIGFGLDSGIEVFSGAVLLWRLRSEKSEIAERRAVRLVGASFLLLSAYILYDAVHAFLWKQPPRESVPGIVLAIASLAAMPLLAAAKRRVARELGSGAMHADSRQTDFCAYLSGIVLLGLILNAVAGWWWADPVAAVVMVPIIAKEGIEAVQGKTCCES
jgi:divalent metal cation (Fe/Co/Zn/Cd) transporter